MKVDQSPVFKSMVFNCELALLGCDAPKEVSLAVICNLYIFRNKRTDFFTQNPRKYLYAMGESHTRNFATSRSIVSLSFICFQDMTIKRSQKEPHQFSVKEPKWKSTQILQFRARFCWNCKIFSYISKGYIYTLTTSNALMSFQIIRKIKTTSDM